jgi:cation transport protein ChaC
MSSIQDPFVHHAELRDKITDPLTSFFRDLDMKEIIIKHPELCWVLDELYSEDYRIASRKTVLDLDSSANLWVFAYGSLMWDPALVFAEVRRAVVPDYSRRFILKDIWGGRGTPETPGLMAALDFGDGCEGLAYRIECEKIGVEMEILWRREMLGPGYLPKFVTALIDCKPTRVLTFVADYTAKSIHPDLTRAEQIKFLSTGAGILGTSIEYLQNIVSQFTTLGIVDEDCSALLGEVQAHMGAQQIISDGSIS